MHGKNESACMRVWRELDRLYAAHSDALLIDCGDDLAVEVQERAKGKKTVWRVGSRHQVRKSFSFNGSFFHKRRWNWEMQIERMKTYQREKNKLCFLR